MKQAIFIFYIMNRLSVGIEYASLNFDTVERALKEKKFLTYYIC